MKHLPLLLALATALTHAHPGHQIANEADQVKEVAPAAPTILGHNELTYRLDTPMLDYYRTLYDEYGNTAINFSSYAIELANEVALNGYTLWIGSAFSDGWLYYNGSAVELGSYGDIALDTSYAFDLSSVGGGIVATDGSSGANFTGAVSSITVVDGIVTAVS